MSEDIRKGPIGPFVSVADGDATAPLTSALFVDPGTLVPFAEQTGFIGLPFGSAQQGIEACPEGGVTLVAPGIAGTIVVERAVTLKALGSIAATILDDVITSAALELVGVTAGTLTAGAAAAVDSCSLTALIAAGELAIDMRSSRVGIVNVPTLAAADSAVLSSLDVSIGADCVDCDLQVDLQGGDFILTRCVSGAVAGGSVLAVDTTTGAVAITGDLEATRSNIQGPATVGGVALLDDTIVLGLLTVTGGGSNQFLYSQLLGGLTATGPTLIYACRIGGSVAVTGALSIDSATYDAALAAGFSVTATGGVTITDIGLAARVIGWNGVGVQNLVVLPASHLPGFYSVSLQVIVRTAGGGTSGLQRSYLWDAPTIGPVTSGTFTASAITATGSPTGSYTEFGFMSSGLGAMTARVAPVTISGAPVVDLYASARLVSRLN